MNLVASNEYLFTKGYLTVIVNAPNYDYDFQSVTTDLIHELFEMAYTRKQGIVYVELVELYKKIEKKNKDEELPHEVYQRFYEIKNELKKIPKVS